MNNDQTQPPAAENSRLMDNASGKDTGLGFIVAAVLALFAGKTTHMWIAGNIIGLAMGASQAVGRALVSKFSPTERANF